MTEFRPSRFQILPTIIKNLLIINVLVFLAQVTIGNAVRLEDMFALHTWQSLFFNMFALWMFGSILENVWGPKRFLTFYLISGLGAALCHMIVLYFNTQNLIDVYNSLSLTERQVYEERFYHQLNEATLGASGAVFGCLAAFGYLFPNTYIYLYFFFPIKAKWFVILYAGFELYMAVQNTAGDNVAHVAHLGGALAGFLMVYFWNKNKKRFY